MIFQKEGVYDASKLYVDEDHTIGLVIISGRDALRVNHEASTEYEVVVGAGFVNSNGGSEVLMAGDVHAVPRGQSFRFAGDLVMLSTSTPGYSSRGVEIIAS
jgi:mannose-6-phosphate isomerase-like protein (cupin superfamily)